MTALDKMWLTKLKQGGSGYTGGLATMTSPTTRITQGQDDNSYPASTMTTPPSIGFDFSFDDIVYTRWKINANGWMVLYTASRTAPFTTPSAYDNTKINALDANIIFAPWWDDLKAYVTSGYVKHELTGSAGSQIFTVEWYCQLYYSQSAAANDNVKFQCRLHEGSNAVEFRYGPLVTVGSPSRGAVYHSSAGVKADSTATLTGKGRGFTGSGYARGGTSGSQLTTMDAVGDADDWPASAANPLGYAYDVKLSTTFSGCVGAQYAGIANVMGLAVDDAKINSVIPLDITA